MKFNKIKRIIALFTLAIILTTSLTACKQTVTLDDSITGENTTQDYPVEIAGVTITSAPDKVAVLSYSLADVILAMGYEASLVLVSDDCTQSDFDTIEKISMDELETLADYGVTFVIAQDLTEEQTATINNLGITLVEIEPAQGRNDFERLYSEVGSVLKGASTGYTQGISTAESIFTSLDDLSRIIPSSDIVITVAMVIDLDGTAITGQTVQDTMMTYSGVTNTFKGSTSVPVDYSSLSISQPDYIFCPEGLKEELMNDENFSSLDAVINGNVYEMPYSYFVSSGRDLVSAATFIAGIAYPELLETESSETELPEVFDEETSSQASEDPESSTDEYETLVKEDISDEIFEMQERLFELGYLAEIEFDGYFGDITLAALNAFQLEAGLTQTNDANNETLVALYASNAPYAPVEEESEESEESSEEE